jgi:hypothetical protein
LPGETRNGVSQYFQLIVGKRFGEAEKKLNEIRQTTSRSEQESGYLKALEGLLLTYRSSDDKYPYLNNVELSAKNAEALRKEFSEQASSPLFENYDKGYFSALNDFMKAVSKLRPWRNRKSTHEEQRPTKKSRDAQ